MSDANWEAKFEEIFNAGVQAHRRGAHDAAAMLGTREEAFLGTIGCTSQELFDFVDDHCRRGEPDFAAARAMTAIRRRYFLEVQHGIPSQFQIDPLELPAKHEELDGFRWLPRIIAKARAKLRGELDPSIMYCCGGDLEFLDSIGMSAPDFLQLVWDAGNLDSRILAAVKSAVVNAR